ncbi:MAG: DUF192 domain-containing protein [Elusimicrobiota bacterium]
MSVRNQTRGTELAGRVRIASSLLDRVVGLLRTPRLEPGTGIWLKPCRSVHTWFMRYPIDVLFLDSDGRVLHQGTLKPWRFSRWVSRSQSVLELSAGTLDLTGTQTGDRLEMKERT